MLHCDCAVPKTFIKGRTPLQCTLEAYVCFLSSVAAQVGSRVRNLRSCLATFFVPLPMSPVTHHAAVLLVSLGSADLANPSTRLCPRSMASNW